MSYIATLKGVLHYDSDDFEEAVQFLKDRQFDGEGVEIDREEHTIRFPKESSRNLGRNLDLLLDLAESGYVIGVSNEVRWHGCVDLADGTSDEYDLMEWASEHTDAWVDNHEFDTPPDPDVCDVPTYFEWQNIVNDAFFGQMMAEYDLDEGGVTIHA